MQHRCGGGRRTSAARRGPRAGCRCGGGPRARRRRPRTGPSRHRRGGRGGSEQGGIERVTVPDRRGSGPRSGCVRRPGVTGPPPQRGRRSDRSGSPRTRSSRRDSGVPMPRKRAYRGTARPLGNCPSRTANRGRGPAGDRPPPSSATGPDVRVRRRHAQTIGVVCRGPGDWALQPARAPHANPPETKSFAGGTHTMTTTLTPGSTRRADRDLGEFDEAITAPIPLPYNLPRAGREPKVGCSQQRSPSRRARASVTDRSRRPVVAAAALIIAALVAVALVAYIVGAKSATTSVAPTAATATTRRPSPALLGPRDRWPRSQRAAPS